MLCLGDLDYVGSLWAPKPQTLNSKPLSINPQPLTPLNPKALKPPKAPNPKALNPEAQTPVAIQNSQSSPGRREASARKVLGVRLTQGAARV